MSLNIEITDHAVVRYLERVHGMDIEFFRKWIKSEIQGFERYQGVVFMNGLSWLYINGKFVSVMKDIAKYKDFRDNHT